MYFSFYELLLKVIIISNHPQLCLTVLFFIPQLSAFIPDYISIT